MAALLLLAAGPAGGQTLRIGTQSPFVIDPHYTFLGPDMAVAREIYDSLVGRDDLSHWVPGLAVSWEAVGERVWEFKLRPGVVFSDGTPFTAEDVAFSFQRVMTLATPSGYGSNMRGIVRWEVTGPLTIRVETEAANAVLPGQLTNIFIVSAAIAAGAGTGDFQSGRVAIGTGPFRVVSYARGSQVELERNERYWGVRPVWARVIERVIGNDASRVAALQAGDVDLIDDVPPTEALRLAHVAGISVYRQNSDRVMFLQPNVRLERLAMLTDGRGRCYRAIRCGISGCGGRSRWRSTGRTLAARAFDDQAVPTAQLVPEGFGGYDPALCRRCRTTRRGRSGCWPRPGIPRGSA